MSGPTRWQHLLFRLLPSADRDQMHADLLELRADRAAAGGPTSANLWLVRHTLLVSLRLRWHALSTATRAGGMSGLWLDLRHVLRGLKASRMFTAVAVLSLALGIGANAAIYGVIRALLLDPMNVPAPQELSLVYWQQPGDLNVSQTNSSGDRDPVTGQSLRSNVSYPISQTLLKALPEGADGFAFNFLRSTSITFEAQPAVVAGGMAADAGYFRVLSPRMALGRPLGIADDAPDAPVAVVLGHAFFMRVFGGDPGVLGRTLRINGIPAEVVGVTAPGFRGLSRGGFFPATDVTVPIRLFPALRPNESDAAAWLTREDLLWVRMMVRLPATIAQDALAQQWATRLSPHLEGLTEADAAPPVVAFRPGAGGLDQTRPETRRLLYVLMGVVAVVLLIACVNLAGLMLARGVARQREVAVRRALGAGRLRLVRTQLLEGLVLATAGGGVGLLITFWSRRVLTSLLTAGLGTAPMSSQTLEVSVDVRLILATFGVSVVAAMLFSVLPALRMTSTGRGPALGHRVAGDVTPRLTLGRALVALQIAVSVPLLVTAVLFLRTVENLGAIDLGFDATDVAFARIDPVAAQVPDDQLDQIYLRILSNVQATAGVTSVTLMENALLSGISSSNRISMDGVDHTLYMNAVGPGFLETMGVRLLAGRSIGMQDGPRAPFVGLLNETAARALFGTTAVVGRTIPWRKSTLEVIGVVADTRYDSARNAVPPTLFDSALQRAGYGGHHVVVKSHLPLDQLDRVVRQAVADVNRNIPVPPVKLQSHQVRESTMRERVFAQLLTIFGGFALLLVSVGLHGVTTYSVQRRTNEIGVRMALGAQPGQVLWMVQRQVVMLAFIGLLVGVPAALAAGPLFSALLYGVAPTSVPVLLVGGGVMLVVAFGAGWFPAYRAARVDPLKALRTE